MDLKLSFRGKIVLGIVWTLFLGFLITVVFVVRWYNLNLKPVDREQTQQQTFVVLRGMQWSEVADRLQESELIHNAETLKWYVRFNNVSGLQAGTFLLSRSLYLKEIVDILSSGLAANIDVTILPEHNLQELEKSLIEQGFKAPDAHQALKAESHSDHSLLRDIIPPGATLEGYVAPETFAVGQLSGESAKAVVRKSLDTFIENLTPEIKAAFAQKFSSIHEGVILASIVELEATPQDRAQVAQVFLSRIEEGMRLDSDIGFFYIAEIENRAPSVQDPSPYNMRQHYGLPPGPVSNVSKSSLEAVANPASGNYLYFLVGDDGNMYFNHTHEEHLQDRDAHCRKGCLLE